MKARTLRCSPRTGRWSRRRPFGASFLAYIEQIVGVIADNLSAHKVAGVRQGQGLNPLLAPIPANDGNWTVTGIGAFQNDAVIQNLFIHAHVRGKDFTYVLTYPDGREKILLRVPKYSFDWQYT